MSNSLPVPVTRVETERPQKQSLYLKAGSPTCCQNPHCKKPFDGSCVRGDDDRYYCSEVCAQVGFEIDFDEVANLRAVGT